MVAPKTGRKLFLYLVGFIAGQRLMEMQVSRQHEQQMRAVGGQEHGVANFRLIKALHASWLISMLVEVFTLKRPFIPSLALAALMVTAVGQTFRYLAIRTLGWRWSTSVMSVPGEPLVERGVYRHIRHPNYIGVVLEIFAVPLVNTAYLTSIVFSILNLILLRSRIQIEEHALEES